MVDSMPTLHGPPSRMCNASPNSARTCAAVVGLTRPNWLALGPASPRTPRSRQARNKARATGWAGQRSPIEPCPPAAAAAKCNWRGRITVRGPGQKACIRARATGGTVLAKCATPSAPWPASSTWTISGCALGRPLAEKIFATAASLPASAPRPYTVSVGKATSSPACSAAAQSRIDASSCPSNTGMSAPIRTAAGPAWLLPGPRRHAPVRRYPP